MIGLYGERNVLMFQGLERTLIKEQFSKSFVVCRWALFFVKTATRAILMLGRLKIL